MQPLVYVDTSEVREGALGQLRDAIRALSGFVEQNEPQLVPTASTSAKTAVG